MKKLLVLIWGLTLVTATFGLIGCEAPKAQEHGKAPVEHDAVHEAYLESLKAQKTMKDAFEALDHRGRPPEKHAAD